jgi:hypothetical protein
MDIEQRWEWSVTLRLVHHSEPGLVAVATVLDIFDLEIVTPCGVIGESGMRHCHAPLLRPSSR